MALLTINHYVNQVNNFITNVRDTRHAYYVFAGRPYPWTNDSSPPPANNSVSQYQQTVYDDLLFGKLIGNMDVQFMSPRYNWTSNTVYAQYDQTDPSLYDKQFFVVTDQFNVYKCIFNNYGANSTVKPTLTATSGNFKTADGYIWKYMYNIDATSNTKFTSQYYIPVLQDLNVQENSIPGTIDAVQITSGGNNYQIYETGNIVKFIDKFTVQLPSTASVYDNYYANSSIYLKSGFGGGQIREIASSNGFAKTIRVNSSTPFNIYQRLDLNSVVGTITNGQTIQQPIDYMYYYYANGYFNVGDTIVQSDTGVSGQIISVNSAVIQVSRTNLSTPFSLNTPIIDTNFSGTLQPGTVTITSGSNTVVSTNTAQTTFTTSFPVGSYIRVGANANTNVRRVTAVNTSMVNVDISFTSSVVNTSSYTVGVAAEPSSITITQANGTVVNTNLSSVSLNIANSSIPGIYFTVGERVDLTNSSNATQSANGIVAYSNSSTVFLSSVNDPSGNFTNSYFWSNNFYISGESSLVSYSFISSKSNPNILIGNFSGSFLLGDKVSTPTGNATLVGTSLVPNDSTEYEIGPTVKITGDGSNAVGIAVVNNQYTSTGYISYLSYGGTTSGYNNTDVVTISSSVLGGAATATLTTNSTGGIIQTTLVNRGYGMIVGSSPTVTVISSNGATSSGTGATWTTSINPSGTSAVYPYNVIGIEMINSGSGFTFANVQIYANSNFGSGATGTALISPINGHGFDTITELGARYAGIDVTFDTGSNESYYFQTYGTYRRIGILEDPQFADVQVTLTSFDRVNLSLNASSYHSGPTYSWTTGEVVIQSTTNAAGIVVTGNSTSLQLRSVLGSFANGYQVSGYYSNTYANTISANVIYFAPGSTAEIVSEVTSGATAVVTAAYSNTLLQLSNVSGQFVTGDVLFDASSNAYANIGAIATANGSKDQTYTLGKKFNQTARITLTTPASGGTFSNNEFVQQDVSMANGRIVSTSDDLDISISGISGGSFSNGQTITDQTTNANGIVLFANSTYLKLTGVSQNLSFINGDTINNGTGVTATASNTFQVLVLNDINGVNGFQAASNNIVGQTSGAVAQVNSYSLITYPELVRESGKVVYMENISPVTRSRSSKEEFKIVVKF